MKMPGFSFNLSSLGSTAAPDHESVHDLLILGGGPASMSAAIYAARKMLKLAVIALDIGGQVLTTSEVENYPGFPSIHARELVSRFEDHVKTFNVPFALGAAVIEVSKEEDIFIVRMEDGSAYRGRTVIYAMGMKHRRLDVTGEAELTGKGVAYCATCDAPFFKDRKVCVVGGGNSAFTSALELLNVNAEVTMLNFAGGWQADEALQNRVRQSGRARFFDEHRVLRIEGTDRVSGVVAADRRTGQEKRMDADGVFIDIGWTANTGPVKNLVTLSEGGEIAVDCSCRTNVPGFFGAGDVTTVPHKQIVISAGEGAKAALSAYDYLVKHSMI
jgi:alkyl hydroperoxide reductase subunit F